MTTQICELCGSPADVQKLVFMKDGHAIVRCSGCGLVRRATVPESGEIARLYELDYFAPGPHGDPAGYLDYFGDETLHRSSARKRLRLLDRYVSVGSLLDVGCAAGFFVDEARRRGWDARGIDIASEIVARGREMLAVPLETAPFRDVDLPEESFDAITMWDYIEHSDDPLADVERASRLLRAGGVLALSTGDIGSAIARVSGQRWHLLTPRHHLFYFNRRTLRLLAARAGLEVVECRARSSRYSLRHLTFKLRSMAEAGPLERLATLVDGSRLGSLAIPVNLGDIVTVLARKRS